MIALPPDWANYGAIISGFKAKYGITVNSGNPNGCSQDEVNAVKPAGTGTTAPRTSLDIGMAVALANTAAVRALQGRDLGDIPDSQKEPTGLWFQDYGGYMSIGYDSSKVPTITSVATSSGPPSRARSR